MEAPRPPAGFKETIPFQSFTFICRLTQHPSPQVPQEMAAWRLSWLRRRQQSVPPMLPGLWSLARMKERLACVHNMAITMLA